MGTNKLNFVVFSLCCFSILGVDVISDYFPIASGIIRCQNREKLLFPSRSPSIDTCNWKISLLWLFGNETATFITLQGPVPQKAVKTMHNSLWSWTRFPSLNFSIESYRLPGQRQFELFVEKHTKNPILSFLCFSRDGYQLNMIEITGFFLLYWYGFELD